MKPLAEQRECYARGCCAKVADRFLMCGEHWALVPDAVAREVYRCAFGKASPRDYVAAIQRARDAVAEHDRASFQLGFHFGTSDS